MICAYLLFEYMRPQSIIPGLDILPWMQIFLLLSAAGYAMQKEREPVARNYVLFWLLLFLAVILLSGFTAFIPEYSWRSLDAYYLWILIFFLITRIATTEKQLMLLILIICLASFKMSAYGAKAWTMRGFSFTSWGLKGPPGFFENSGEFAVQMLVFFGISMYLFFAFRHRISGWRYWFLLAAPITAGMSVMGASSRGSQIALAGLLYLIFLHGKISIRAVLLSAIIGYTAFSFLPEEQLARFQEIGEDKTSQQRMLYWENGWEMMQEFPVLGVGYYNFIPYFETYYPGDMLYPEAQLAHNIFVQVGADLGFVGLFVYLVLIFLGFSIPRKARRRLIEMGLEEDWRVYMSKGLALGFLGFLIAGQFVSIVYYPFMYIHLALVCVLLNSVESTRREMERASGNHSERVPATEELPVA
ncbi:MAG: O-antigen ligase family protein [Pseudomonadota bacterium]